MYRTAQAARNGSSMLTRLSCPRGRDRTRKEPHGALFAALTALDSSSRSGGCAPHPTRAADAQLRAIYTRGSGSGAASSCPTTRTAPARSPITCRRSIRRRRRCASGTGRTCCSASSAIARASLSAPEQVNYDIYRPQIEVLIANQRFRDFEMPANSDTTFWTDIGYTARRPFRTLHRLPALDRADARHPALLPRADGRDARRHEARLHAAARHHGGTRRLDHRGHGGDPGGESVLHALQGHAGHRRRRGRRPCARRRSRSSAKWCSRRTSSC